MGTLAQDLKYGIRFLIKSPAFSAAAVLILALGIGANTAIFTVVNAILLRPLPFQDSSRLVWVPHVPPAKSFPGMSYFSVSPANYLDWQKNNHVFESMAAYGGRTLNLADRDEPEAIPGASVSAEFFPLLGVPAQIGRVFLPEDDQPGHGLVVVLSHRLWQSHFGSDASIVGTKLTLSGESYTVIGVMPARFELAAWFPSSVQLWVPVAWTEEQRAVRNNHNYNVVARLKAGVDVNQAQAEMNAISSRLARAYPEDDQGWGAAVVSLRQFLTGDVRPALLVLFGAVAFVLLIACANVANLVLARTLGRRKEMAIRSALGAGRSRAVGQVLSETVLLSLAGGGVGLLLAGFGVKLIVAFLAKNLPRGAESEVDGRVLAFTLALSLLTGLIAGLASALRLAQGDLNEALKQGLGRTDSASTGARTRGALVMCEVALSLILLIGAGLMIRSLWNLQRVHPGFDSHNVLTMTVVIPGAKYSQASQKNGFFERVVERIQRLHGVDSAGLIDSLPLSGGSTQPIVIEGRPSGLLAEQPEVEVRRISPGYLRTMRIPLIAGRNFREADQLDKKPVVLISQTLAKRFWPSEDPIGKRLTMSFFPGILREVVGIVGDVKDTGLNVREPVATLYTPFLQIPGNGNSLVVRADAAAPVLMPAITDAIHQVDREQPVRAVKTMDAILAESLSQTRFSMLLLASFAGLASLLAAAGIYSVLSYAVRRRLREIGIRIALGGQRTDMLRLVVIEGMKPVAAGVLIGLAGSAALGKIMSNLIYGLPATDPLTYLAVTIGLTAVALAASTIPAYRATTVDPIQVLRED